MQTTWRRIHEATSAEAFVVCLCKHAVECGDVEANPHDGTTPLSQAIAAQHMDAVALLLQTNRLPMGLDWRCHKTGMGLRELASSARDASPELTYLVSAHVNLLDASFVPTLATCIADWTPLIPPLAQLVVDALVGPTSKCIPSLSSRCST
jgi:hypothetical protein